MKFGGRITTKRKEILIYCVSMALLLFLIKWLEAHFIVFNYRLDFFIGAIAVGAFDITDIINNILGGLVGLMIYKGIEKVFENSVKAQKFINILAISGTIFMIVFLFLLKTNNLWIRYQ